MGKRSKEHRKKVAARNQQIKSAQKAYEKLYNEQMMKYIEDMKAKAAAESGTTESDQSTISAQ
jgi:N-glycosylase/DNA lyase